MSREAVQKVADMRYSYWETERSSADGRLYIYAHVYVIYVYTSERERQTALYKQNVGPTSIHY